MKGRDLDIPGPGEPVLWMSAVQKQYQALRPLRVRALTIAAAERVAVTGFDAGAAEVLVNLVTGAGLPDRGEVRVLGRSTADLAGSDEWLAWLDRFGIVSDRAVLLEGATLEQNLAMPFTLQIDPVPADTASRVAELAKECGIPSGHETIEGRDTTDWLRRPASEASPEVRIRAHLARAIALDPRLLLLEHPTASIPEAARGAFAADVVRVTEARRLAALVITTDERFARRLAHRTLRLNPATGELRHLKGSWFTS